MSIPVYPSEELNPLREWVPVTEEPFKYGIHEKLGCQMWMVPGWGKQACTEYTLLEQRMYSIHANGRWSRPKDHSTTIFISEDT